LPGETSNTISHCFEEYFWFFEAREIEILGKVLY